MSLANFEPLQSFTQALPRDCTATAFDPAVQLMFA